MTRREIFPPAPAVDLLRAYLDSGLCPPDAQIAATGTGVLYAEELLDLYGLLPAAARRTLLPFFDEAHYRAGRPDLDPAACALTDFLVNGLPAQISPHPLVDLDYMAFLRPDLMVPHEITPARFWGLFTQNLVAPSPFFDPEHYRKHLTGTPVSPSLLLDFLSTGAEPRPSPHPLVDLDRYRALRPDAPPNAAGALLHLIATGDADAVPPGPGFDPVWYLRHYANEADPVARPFWHYLRYGRFAGRAPRAADLAKAAAAAPCETGDRDSATILGNHRALAARIARTRSARIERVREADIRPVIADDPEALLSGLAFAPPEGPAAVDILIPCYQEFGKTVECLAAIASAPPVTPHRVILIDDASPDPRFSRFATVPGLTVLRHPANLHFLRSCNAAFSHVTARHLLLLNNDAQLLPGALDRLVAALDAEPEIAAAVPMILYPNGRLQEAGCTIAADGSTGMTGVGDDPARPCYGYDRDVDYGSGACLLVRRDALGGQLFDERFAPAYCEDVDLCLRLRADGHRIRYVAEARCIHHLSASTSAMSELRRRQLIHRNQQKLQEKWGEALIRGRQVRALAFYLPQFHPTPQNDLWWGKGFTEWTNVSKARPSYEGHYQPHLPGDLGFYDLRLTETMEAQMALARRYGVEGFVMYYYNFDGNRVLGRPLENLLAEPATDFRFALCWANENWTRHWDGGSTRHALMTQDYGTATLGRVAADAVAAAALPGAIRVQGRPLFLIYRPLLIPGVADVTAMIRARFREAGLGNPYLAYVESMETATAGTPPADLGFDASVEFPPQGIAEKLKTQVRTVKPGFLGHLYDYSGTVVNACDRGQPGYRRFPGVMPSWDNTPRQPMAHTTLEGALPERFQAYAEAKLADVYDFLTGDKRLLFVNAWNEWAEGAHLEPDRRYEHDWLRALADAMDAARWRAAPEN